MKITEDVRKYAAERELHGCGKQLKEGLKQKATESRRQGLRFTQKRKL